MGSFVGVNAALVRTFGKGDYPSVFERIFGSENPRHVQILGVVLLLWAAFSAFFFVMPLWPSQ